MGRWALIAVGYGSTGLLVFLTVTRPIQVERGLAAWVGWVALVPFLPAMARFAIQVCTAPFYEPLMAEARRQRLAITGAVASHPSVSVLVPAWNEEVGIIATVESILASDYPDLEVIVIDDGSTDGTSRAVAQLVEHQSARGEGHRLRLVTQRNTGKAGALNRGVQLARGEIIVTTDADSVMEPDAISHIVRVFEDTQAMSVAGNVKVGSDASAVGLVQQMEYAYSFFVKKSDALLNTIYIVGGAAAAYRREVFDLLGGFDEDIITEDIEMSTRIQDAGWKVSYAADAVIWTEGAADLPGLARQRLRWKFGRLVTFWRYRHMFFRIGGGRNPWLTVAALPGAAFADLALLMAPVASALLLAHSLWTSDFRFLLAYAVVLAIVFVIAVMRDRLWRRQKDQLLMAPVMWVVAFLIELIEVQALVRSVVRMARGQGLAWQRWQRRGVFVDAPAVLRAPMATGTAEAHQPEVGGEPRR